MPARPIEPVPTMEALHQPAWQGLSVSEAAAASSIAFRPMRRLAKVPDHLAQSRETGRSVTGDGPRRHESGAHHRSRSLATR